MDSDYVFLIEKEAMWAEMLIEALQKADIPAGSVPVYGAGLVTVSYTHLDVYKRQGAWLESVLPHREGCFPASKPFGKTSG